jgi:hypothetical protein
LWEYLSSHDPKVTILTAANLFCHGSGVARLNPGGRKARPYDSKKQQESKKKRKKFNARLNKFGSLSEVVEDSKLHWTLNIDFFCQKRITHFSNGSRL